MNGTDSQKMVVVDSNPPKAFEWILMIPLSWLGLAGFVDNLVEWQQWFEQGIMEHWRSVKQWMIATLFDWLPFRVTPWMVDYLVLAGIAVRAMPKSQFLQQSDFREIQPEWALKVDLVLSRIFISGPKKLLGALLWPLIVLNSIVSQFLDYTESYSERRSLEVKAKNRKFLFRMAVLVISFIPVLFVLSKALYKHG